MPNYSKLPDHLLLVELLVEALHSDDEPLREIALEFSCRIHFDLVRRLVREIGFSKRPASQPSKLLDAIQQLGGIYHPDHYADLSLVHALDKNQTVKSKIWSLLSARPDLAAANGPCLLVVVAGPAARG